MMVQYPNVICVYEGRETTET